MLVSPDCSEVLSADTRTLVGRAESHHTEFKASTWHAYEDSEIPPEILVKKLEAEVIEGIAGLLNSEGGCMLIGVSNDNEILGLQEDLKTRSLKDLDEYENTLMWISAESGNRYPHPAFEFLSRNWMARTSAE